MNVPAESPVWCEGAELKKLNMVLELHGRKLLVRDGFTRYSDRRLKLSAAVRSSVLS